LSFCSLSFSPAESAQHH